MKFKKTEEYKKYKEYISSEKWKQLRNSILQERGFICEDCGAENVCLHIHHKTYKNLYNEKPKDLQVLCPKCHKKRHTRPQPDKSVNYEKKKQLRKASKRIRGQAKRNNTFILTDGVYKKVEKGFKISSNIRITAN